MELEMKMLVPIVGQVLGFGIFDTDVIKGIVKLFSN